ncbi:hypothetical protein BLA28_04495 [Eisenbergiella tayi]|uniref:Bacterial extracellular solute-binding protein n=1 Tax=Eisenbergiella tayi TaxID=1432052 RepID=A0A1E3AXZ8_9FIRM|nr:extracellular solute-binding protein [Eisenbergiella tayi]ODM13592.1 Bacterial extracellular solute-binding protein [Eisenbergiella tayi]OIZ66228.1 hypothetical protein BLA28_04495 [Eisenbergiella tayi]
MKKKLFSLLLCVTCIGTLLTGCQMTDSTEGVSAVQEESSDVASEENDADSTAVSKTANDAVKLDLYIDFTWFPTDTWTGIIPETLTANGGVTFDVTRSADDSQLGLMIASGDLPDVIFTSDEIDRLCDSNLCWSYDELIETYGVDWQPSQDRIGIARSHNANPEDEHYYTIIQNYNTNEEWENAEGVVPSIACVYYRKDIWRELGEPAMDTMEDLINVCKMVREKYPEMMPVNAGSPSWRLTPFQSWTGAASEFIYTDESHTSVAYTDTTAEFYDYLKYVNEMYREGLFSEENLAIINQDDGKQQALNGKCFVYEWNSRPTQLAQLNTSTQANVEGAEWASMPIPDDAKTIVRTNAGWAGVFISKKCKDPEAAIKMIAYMNSTEGQHLALWGREGIDYVLDEKGTPQFSDEWLETSKDQDLMTSKFNNNYFMCTTELDEAYTYYSGADPEVIADFSKNLDKVVNYPELSIALPVSTSDMGIIRAKIKEAREAELVKIYTAETDEEFEASYKDYMRLLDQIGVQELNKYMTEETADIKTKFNF